MGTQHELQIEARFVRANIPDSHAPRTSCVAGQGRLSVLVGIFSIIALTVVCSGIALVCITVVQPLSLYLLGRWPRCHRCEGSPIDLIQPMKCLLLFLLLVAQLAGAQPAQVILLRHAEKPDDPADLHLSPRGEERAGALVSLLGRSSPFTSNAPVVALHGTRVTKHDHSHRTGETLAPVSKELGLPVNTTYDSDNYVAAATSVMNTPAFRGKTVIVCWTHHDLAQLAGALGVHPTPDHWKEKTFDRLWVITYSDGRADLHDVPQRLLKGDTYR